MLVVIGAAAYWIPNRRAVRVEALIAPGHGNIRSTGLVLARHPAR
jgi:hypothetical protein